MLFVFDTNVLVSACLKPLNLPALALNHAQEIGQIVFTDETLSELKEVISRPFIEKYLTKNQHKYRLQQIVENALIVENLPILGVDCRDEKDIKFLEVAISSKVECVVSGDKDLLILHPFRGIPILNAADFLKSF